MTLARDRFQKGDRVGPTAHAIRATVARLTERGTVVGFSHNPACVRIQRDGRKQPTTYHMDFWQVLPEGDDDGLRAG